MMALTEILHGGQLKSALKSFKVLGVKQQVTLDGELFIYYQKLMRTQMLDIVTPHLFVATIKESASLPSSASNDKTNMTFVCQPYIDPCHIMGDCSAVLTALTHHSLLESDWQWVLVDFKGMKVIDAWE
jgi:hypothetical protein